MRGHGHRIKVKGWIIIMGSNGPNAKPKLSIVIAARNDDYGGNFLHRMQVFINCLVPLWQRSGLNAELIIVEWNPPEDKVSLAEALKWPSLIPTGGVRIIQVPGEMHRRFPNSDRIAMFEYMAKNVGIRRAKGDYVLITNPDIVFNEEIIRSLAPETLSDDCFYRIDRFDVESPVPLEMDVDAAVGFCSENLIRVRSAMGTIPLKRLSAKNKDVYRGYLSKLASPRTALRWFMMKFIFKLHTGAPGDFTLMSKRSWDSLRGYPELPSQRHIDSYLCSMAKSSGLSQVVFKSPSRIYHQDHDTGEMAARPSTDYDQYWNDTKQMLKSRKPIILNDDTWGLGSENLVEIALE